MTRFDEERAAEKMRARQRDQERLDSCQVTREQLRAENSLFPFGTKFTIIHSGGSPRRRKT